MLCFLLIAVIASVQLINPSVRNVKLKSHASKFKIIVNLKKKFSNLSIKKKHNLRNNLSRVFHNLKGNNLSKVSSPKNLSNKRSSQLKRKFHPRNTV